MYGYSSDETIITSGNNLKFGLNQNVTIDELSYHKEEDSEYLKFVVDVAGTKVQTRKYKVEKVLGKNGNYITDTNNPEFIKAELDLSSWVVHILSCFYDKQTLKNILNREFTSFANYGKTIESLINDEQKLIKLDIFLQYQWSIGKNADRTYLSVPPRVKYGKWICKHVEGNFEEVINKDKELKYIDKENNIKHPFSRSSWFMNSNFARLQVNESSSDMEFPLNDNNKSNDDYEERTPEW